jgi:hypothetical protein
VARFGIHSLRIATSTVAAVELLAIQAQRHMPEAPEAAEAR